MLKKSVVAMVVGMTMTGLTSGVAIAGIIDGAGTYTGAGATFSRDGVEITPYQIEMVRTAVGDKTLESRGKITLPNGQVHEFFQRLTETERGFYIESDHGNGGGYCFGEGLCQSYIGDQAHGFAIAIALDGSTSFRAMITELENGRAVRFIREKLTKKD